jgi:1-deoxy-D-xylulose-5-phosphate synthase
MISPENITSPAELKKLDRSELPSFADQVRRFLISSISQTGGHIGSNLCTVDLTIALHYFFNSPSDKFIWDTGHQGYTHKIITGRAHMFPTLNTYGGMNRFITRQESEHDTIEASHAGTSLSVALGIALAKKLKNDQNYAIAIIGDGALCEGIALEGLNHAAVEKGVKLIIVLNDNGYAISPGFGALHNYLQERKVGSKDKETLFTSLGLEYIGPVDGHNIDQMLSAFEHAKRSAQVPLVHVKTIKGYGLQAADEHPYRLHFSFPFNPSTGKPKEGFTSVGYQDIAARVIGEEMEREGKIICITPSTLYATGLQEVFNRFPDRCFDPGMEEQHAMTMTLGFGLEGLLPIIFYQSTFMQRAFDQLIHDVCFMNFPVLILTVRTGFAGYDNPTHHGIYDFAYLRGLPNLRILYPKDRFELERMIRNNLRSLSMPTIIGMPYGAVDAFDESVLSEPPSSFAKAQVVHDGKDLLLITVGHKFGVAREVIKLLHKSGVRAGLINLRYIKPLPAEQLLDLMRRTKRVVTLEEGVLDGGVGSAIAALAADNSLDCEILRIGISCTFVEPGSNAELCSIYGLDPEGVLTSIKKRWGV